MKSILDTTNGEWVVTADPLVTAAYNTDEGQNILTDSASVIEGIATDLNLIYGEGRFVSSNPPGKPRH